jgi:hypothetical protein
MLALHRETKRLAALPAPVFAPQTAITVADAILLESAPPTNGIAVAVLQHCVAGTAGTQEDLGRVCNRLALIKKGLHEVALRIAPPFFLAPPATYPQVLTNCATGKSQRRSHRGRDCSP